MLIHTLALQADVDSTLGNFDQSMLHIYRRFGCEITVLGSATRYAKSNVRRRWTMITGRQIREARKLLGWNTSKLCERAKLQLWTLQRAESTDSTPPITIAQAAKIQAVCEEAGVRFGRADVALSASLVARNDPPAPAS